MENWAIFGRDLVNNHLAIAGWMGGQIRNQRPKLPLKTIFEYIKFSGWVWVAIVIVMKDYRHFPTTAAKPQNLYQEKKIFHATPGCNSFHHFFSSL
jgi:hypothetical protein